MSFAVVLPSLEWGLTDRCVDSMCLALRDNLLLVDNTDDGFNAERLRPVVGRSLVMGRNAGVASAWNCGLAWAEERGAEYLIIVSQSIRFGDKKGLDFLAELTERHPPTAIHAQCGWKLMALHRDVWRTVGRFDPMFNPGYFEDTDYLYRMGLAGLPSPRENDGRFDQVDVDIASAGDALMLARSGVKLGAQEAKYVHKWNGLQGEERWKRPYGHPLLDWTYTGEPPNEGIRHAP